MHRRLMGMQMSARPVSPSKQQLHRSQMLLSKQQAPVQQALTYLPLQILQAMAMGLLMLPVCLISLQPPQCCSQQMCQRRCLA